MHLRKEIKHRVSLSMGTESSDDKTDFGSLKGPYKQEGEQLLT